MDFERVLTEVSRFLTAEHFRFGLAGAFAMHAHGMGRQTSDIDFVVEEKAQPALLRFLASLGDVLVPSPEHVAAMKVQAMKSNPGRTFKEMADIQFLLELPGIDEGRIRGYFQKQGLLARFDELKQIIERDRDPSDAG